MLLAMLLAACGTSQHEREAGWKRALQMELDATRDQWEAAVAVGRFPTNAEAMRDLKARYEQVYARWALPVDPFSQALFSYAVALAGRVDRGSIPRQQANQIYDTLKSEIEAERRTISADTPPGQREEVMLQRWEGFWATHQQTYQATPRNPIRCSVNSSDAEGHRITCE